ncbi:hypothetical protein GW17_00058095 [Ensete ventricosum]|nr:hypothetical protein GW17_00058095 [Ensete ventricosum]
MAMPTSWGNRLPPRPPVRGRLAAAARRGSSSQGRCLLAEALPVRATPVASRANTCLWPVRRGARPWRCRLQERSWPQG